MIRVEFSDWHDASHTVDALLVQADRVELLQPILARRLRRIADQLGSELDRVVPIPSGHEVTGWGKPDIQSQTGTPGNRLDVPSQGGRSVTA